MTWTTTEWEAFCGLVEEGWPGEFDDQMAGSWKLLLDEVPPAEVVTALKRLLLSGRKFYPRPAVSDLLAELRSDPSQPTFDEMVKLVYRAACYYGRERMDWLQERSPLIAAFVESQGPERLFTLQLDDPEWGEQRRRELREAWANFLTVSEKREVAAIASGEGMRQLDPAAALGLPSGERVQ